MKILVLYRKRFTFVKLDLDILETEHEVRELNVDYRINKAPNTINEYIQGVKWADIILSWFGGHHALIPFLLAKKYNRPCLIVASGYDVANEPEINYGHMRPGVRRPIGKKVFHLADRILAVSDFTVLEIKKNISNNLKNVRRIYHGLPYNPIEEITNKEKVVVTIGNVKHNNLNRKGLESFVKSANYLPDAKFELIGDWLDESIHYLKKIAPPNLKFTGFVKEAGDSDFVKSSKVYVQASYYESFGLSVAESMLHGCVPVVTNRGALPEVVGNTGFYVPYGDPEQLAAGIQKALLTDPEDAIRARQRIIDQFPLENRSKKLLDIVQEVSNQI
jgi:glycosyltransferase involved in cell wall biosynthesis